MKTMRNHPILPTDHQSVFADFFTLRIRSALKFVFIFSFTVASYTALAQVPADPGNPTSDSPQCSNPGVTLNSNGMPPAGETWYWQTSATGTSTLNSASTYIVTTSGTYYIRAQDDISLNWSNGAGSITITITPDVGTPIFTLGATSTRCQGAGAVTYTATATDNTGITYTLDATSIAGGNSIDAFTGEVTYAADGAEHQPSQPVQQDAMARKHRHILLQLQQQ